MSFEFTIEDAAFRAFLESAMAAAGDIRAPMDAVGLLFAERARGTFVAQQDPWGGPWAPLSPVTLARRRDEAVEGATILRDTSTLLNSLMHAPDATGVDIRIGNTNRPAQVHQFGNPNNRFFGKALAPIPARPMLPIRGDGSVQLPPDWVDDLIDITRIHIGGEA